MDSGADENLWFINQLDETLKADLLGRIEDKADIDKIHEAVMGKYKEGKGVETNKQCYERVQKLKQQLKCELTDEVLPELAKSTRHKILVMTHSRVLQCLTASGFDPDASSFRGEGKGHPQLPGCRYFKNCEIKPFEA